MSKTKRTAAPKTRAAQAGASDGAVVAWIKPDHCDPTGGFIKRVELTEGERKEYCAAYEAGFKATLKLTRWAA